jgi:hypothetical protein
MTILSDMKRVSKRLGNICAGKSSRQNKERSLHKFMSVVVKYY